MIRLQHVSLYLQIESEEADPLFDEPVESKSESAKKTKTETGKKPTKTATASIFDGEDDDGLVLKYPNI